MIENTPPQGFPNWYWDPLQYTGLRMRKLCLGKFIANNTTYVYERYDPDVIREDGWKTFLVIPIQGVEGRLLSTDTVEIENTTFDYYRWSSILRSYSLREWWASHNFPVEARWLYTNEEGDFRAIEAFRLRDLPVQVDTDPPYLGA